MRELWSTQIAHGSHNSSELLSLGGDGFVFLNQRLVFIGKRMDGFKSVLGSLNDEPST